MKNSSKILICALATILFLSCDKDDSNSSSAKLIFKFKFDKTQERLDNFGNPSTIPPNHRAQSPDFNEMAAHYIELTTNPYTPLGQGTIIYNSPKMSNGAFIFNELAKSGEGEVFFEIPLNDIAAGNYTWIRVSLAYQNYDIQFRINPSNEIPITEPMDLTATVASFIGTKTYIENFLIKTEEISVYGDKNQGYWALETSFLGNTNTTEGQAPEGSTTVPNPLHGSSPLPPNSCVVTGPFSQPLVITGNETKDIVVTVSVSVNNSFEWEEMDNNDYYEPLDGDMPVDMGVRGIIPYVQYMQ